MKDILEEKHKKKEEKLKNRKAIRSKRKKYVK